MWRDELLHDCSVECRPTHPLLFHYCSLCVCERPRIDVGAQAALGEHTDSAHISKNRWNESPRLEPLRRRRDKSTMLGAAAQKWLVGDVSMVKTPSSFFRILNMDIKWGKKEEAPAVPVLLSDHIRAFRHSDANLGRDGTQVCAWHTNLKEAQAQKKNIDSGSALCNLWM